MSTFEIQHFKNQELAKAYMQGVHDITEWLLKPSERTATNFNKLTASPEALAKFISKALWHIPIYQSEEKCPFYKSCHELCDKDVMCDECITQWLKQEAKKEAEE